MSAAVQEASASLQLVRGAAIHGLDVEPDAIAHALQRLAGGDFRLGVTEELPWPDESFDAVPGSTPSSTPSTSPSVGRSSAHRAPDRPDRNL
jgi:hypothetical protein